MAVFDITFLSSSLRRQTQLTAILPVEPPPFPGFGQGNANKPLRSLFLLHGYMGSNVDWIRGSRIEQLAQMHNLAVFCPSGENSFFLDDLKRGALYEQLVCKELIDFTRRVFPVSHERKDTAVGGLSMGGYGALHSGLKHPEVFGSVIALSSALITDQLEEVVKQPDNPMASPAYYIHTFGDPEKVKGSDADPKALAKKIVDSGAPRPNVYIACGTEDFLIAGSKDLSAYMTSIGYDHTYAEGPGIHSWDFWDTFVEKALVWLDGLK
jgi:S-formylglutathione hydrolase FrmB